MHTLTGAEVIVDDDVVIKVHRAGTDPRDLATRLLIATRLGGNGHGTLLAPLSTVPERFGARWRTRWPRVETVPQRPERAPWPEAGRLLARLHREPLGDDERSVQQGGPQRLRRALYALNHHESIYAVTHAAAALPMRVWAPGGCGRPQTLVHGGWHLGQMGRRHGGPWQLLDVDDLGVGDPAWDLAGPAGFWAAGLLPDADWHAFIDAYREAGGVGLPQAPEDPWTVLEPLAHAAVVLAAAAGAMHGKGDEAQEILVEACARMAG
jgi:aminoglycoside phosphotransferase (APT) family kinase protein